MRLIQIIIGVTQLYPQAWYESRKYGRSTRVIIKHLRIRELKKRIRTIIFRFKEGQQSVMLYRTHLDVWL